MILSSCVSGWRISRTVASMISRQVVRRNVGRHADRDAGRTVDEKIGNAGGKNFGLELALIVVGAEIDRFLIDVFEQRGGDAGKPGFGVPHGRGRIAIDGAEVALAIDQRVAHGEILRHADERIVDGGVAVRVEFARTSPTILAHLRVGRLGARPISLMPKRMRRWTGLRPSRMSGRARPTITLMA